MKIAYVVERYHRHGGHERVVAELAERLLADHDVHVIARDWCDVRRPGIVFHRVAGPSRPAVASYAQFVARSSLAASRGAYDVVHSQGPNCLHQNVVTVHTTQRPKTAILRSLPLFWERLSIPRRAAWLFHQCLAIAVEAHVYRKASTRLIIALSEGIRGELIRDYGAAPERIVVIPNGVDLEEFHPVNRARWRQTVRREMGIGEDEFLCLFVGGEWERKGLDTAIRSLARVPCDRRVRLAVAGSGPVRTYASMAQEVGLGERVLFLGHRPTTGPLYAAADVFIMPSRYEACSLVMLEAAATGLAIVSTPVSGVPDVLTDGQNALIVPEDDRAFARALSRLVDDDALRLKLGARARERAEQFGWDMVACRIDSAYRSRLAR